MKNRLSQQKLMLSPKTKVAAKIKHSDPLSIQVELRLKAIGECLIFSGTDLTASEQSGWSFVHIASKSFSMATVRWMMSVNKALRDQRMEVFDF